MRNPRICGNPICKVDFPHYHVNPDGSPSTLWRPTIDDPAVSAPWPDRLHWKRAGLTGRHPYRLFQFGWFASHSKFQLPWKLSFDCMGQGPVTSDWTDVAEIIAWKFAFRSVYGIPRGGSLLAKALDKYCEPGYPVLIVDDVLTTGRSFIEARAKLNLLDEPVIGVVVAARGPCPNWVWPILTVNEWAQSRATGLG